MKLLRLQFIRFLLLAILDTAMLESSEDIFSEMSELMDFCPYSTFCNQNASSPFPYSDGYIPCCQSCSCDLDCGLHGDCCFSQLDEVYTESAQTVVCRSAFVVEPSENELPNAYLYRYRMIDGCRNNGSKSDRIASSCEQLSSDAVESFHPVASRSTGFIYTNELCALCNDVSDAVPWRRAVTCSPNKEASFSESVEGFLSGKHPSGPSGCHVYYIPPLGFDLPPAEACNPKVKRTCNKALFEIKKYAQYRKLCEKFNATFTARMRSFVHSYANVYCFLCNTGRFEVNTSELLNKKCEKPHYVYSHKSIFGFRLTVLLDLQSNGQTPVSKGDGDDSDCPVNHNLVTSYTKECRRVRCPWGQFQLNNRCDYYSKMWTGGPFSVMLRLIPVKRDTLIPSSFFKDMPEYHKNDARALWIIRKALRRWKFLVLYHLYQDKAAVEYIVVKATYPSTSVNPEHLRKMVKDALDDTWQIVYNNSSVALMVEFNDYHKYGHLTNDNVRQMGINTTEQVVYFPEWVFCMGHSAGKIYYKEILYPVSTLKTDERVVWTTITKLFLCDQVDLDAEEYDNKCNIVFFKVKNTTIHAFDVVKSTSSETSKTSVRVCLQEFHHAYSSGLVTSSHAVVLLSTLFYIFSEMFFI